jgi:DNA polymerase III alpha subunit
MRLDQFNNPIFNETDIFDALYLGHQSVLPNILAEQTIEIANLEKFAEFKFATLDPLICNLSIEEYDKQLQADWFMPPEYYTIDIEMYCISRCKLDIEKSRVLEELAEYKTRGMQPLLQWLIYFVDTCKKDKIVWGVGRGSSVSSFVLYLLEVHKIHSIKYNLDWRDFLR